MKTRHMGAALSSLISIKKTNQIAISKQSGVSQPAINRLIQGARPTPETLNAITHAWENQSDNIALLMEHLRDEIHRAGHKDGSIKILPRQHSDWDEELINTLIGAARIDQDVRALLIDLANLINRSQALSIAADPPGTKYKGKNEK